MAVRGLERRRVRLNRRRVAQLEELQRLAPVERDAHVDVGGARAQHVVLAQRRRAVAALDAEDRPHRARLEQRHRDALELRHLVVVGAHAVTPGVARGRRRRRHASRPAPPDRRRVAFTHELRDPAGRGSSSSTRCRFSSRVSDAASGSPSHRPLPHAVGAIPERRHLDREDEPAAQAAHRRQRPRQLHRHRLARVVDDARALARASTCTRSRRRRAAARGAS